MKVKEMERETEASQINRPRIVSPQEWEAARQKLLVKEKELTRARDALAAERRLLYGGRPGGTRRPSKRPRYHARVRLARATGGSRAPESTNGLGDAVV